MGFFMGFNGIYPLVMTNSSLLNMAIDILDFPIHSMVIFQFAMLNYQRVFNNYPRVN